MAGRCHGWSFCRWLVLSPRGSAMGWRLWVDALVPLRRCRSVGGLMLWSLGVATVGWSTGGSALRVRWDVGVAGLVVWRPGRLVLWLRWVDRVGGCVGVGGWGDRRRASPWFGGSAGVGQGEARHRGV